MKLRKSHEPKDVSTVSSQAGSFQLARQPWILALDLEGRVRELSWLDVYAESGRLRCLVGDLPTQRFAMLRLLLAVLHRVTMGPPDEETWKRLWRDPSLPMADIEDYLDHFGARLDLLHPETPFYQVADLHTAKGESFGLERIIADVPNGHQYLTSRLDLASVTPAEAARWVVHCQAYDTSGIKSGAVGDERVKGGRGYPIGPGLCGSLGGVFLEGQTLRETLLLNLVPGGRYIHHDHARDQPTWERPPHGPAEEPEQSRGPFGVLSLYTWQSRRIRLFGDGEKITGALIANGDKLDLTDRHNIEPMSAWRLPAANAKKAAPVTYTPARHDHTRSLWRGLYSILPTSSERAGASSRGRLVPLVAQWLARAHNSRLVEPGFRVTTSAVGAVYGTQQAVFDDVYHDELSLSADAFDPETGLPVLIIDAAGDAEAAVSALRTLAMNVGRAAGGWGDKGQGTLAGAADRASELAYAALDPLFRRWTSTLTAATDKEQARASWQQAAFQAVTRIGDDIVAQAGPSAWVGRTTADGHHITSYLADVWFRRALRKALPLVTGATPDADEPESVPLSEEVVA